MATDAVTVSPTFNGDSVSLTAGMIVRLKPGANNNVVRAQADSTSHVQGVNGVVISGASAPGGVVTVACVGRETVQMESGLTPNVGDTVFVSPNVAGKGTNVLPGQPFPIGTIADISNYARLGTVEADVNIGAAEPGAGGTFPGFGTGVAGPSAVGSVGVAATARRSDQIAAAYRSDLPLSTTWFIDPVAGSDAVSNPGTTNATALKTRKELLKRWWTAEITQNTTVTVLGDIPPTDVGAPLFTVSPGVTVTWVGSLGPTTGFGGRAIDNTLYIGSVTAVQTAPRAPSTNDTHITDAAIPVSYTASGLLNPGILFKRTNSTQADWWGLLDLGSKTLRITPPGNGSGTFTNLAIGDTYSAFQCWTIYDQDFGAVGDSVVYDSLYDLGGQNELFTLGPPQLNRVWSTRNRVRIVHTINCLFTNPSNNAVQLTPAFPVPAQIVGGGFLGSAAPLTVPLFGTLGIQQGWACENATFSPIDGGYFSVEGPGGFYDCSGPLFLEVDATRVALNLFTAGDGISGSGNTSKLVKLGGAGSFYYGINSATPPFVAGSTSDVNPLQIDANSYPFSSFPAADETTISAGTSYLATTGVVSAVATVDAGGFNLEAFSTPEINLMALGTTNINMPLVPGKSFYMFQGIMVVDTRDAAATTGLSFQITENGVNISNGTGGLSVAQLNALAAPFRQSAAPLSTQLVSATSFPLQFQVTVAVAGAGMTTCTGRYIVIGYFA